MKKFLLTERDHAMLSGEMGPGTAMAMKILTRMAPIYGATSLLDITGAHIDSSVYMGIATLEYAEKLAALGARVVVPSTLNVTGVDEEGWEEWAVPSDHAANARRQMVAYQSMGCIPTWTCAPYQTEYRPVFGQQIASGESNAICFFNSAIGARTERYPDLLDICAAVTGRVPAAGLHLSENRRGTVHIRLENIPFNLQDSDVFYPVLGHLIGSVSPDGVPVITGLEASMNDDRHKALCAGAASAGAVALYHIVGQTPEAHSVEEAFHGNAPENIISVGMARVRESWRALSTADGDGIDMVLLGSPHFSITEFARLVPMISGKRRSSKTEILVTCSRAVRMLAEEAGFLQPFLDFGGRVTVDTCPLTSPMLPSRIRLIMTNSAKYAYYSPGLLGTEVTYGSLEDCIRSCISGRVERNDELWNA